jgi:NifU-like protein
MVTLPTKLKEHFLNPRNAGEMDAPTVIGESGSMAAGQAMRLYLRVNGDDAIEDARFQVFGSPGAIAAGSALTEMIRGMPMDEAARVTAEQISGYLGGVPENRMHACVTAMEALESAYARFRGIDLDTDIDDGTEFLVCRCHHVPEHKIERAIRDNHLTSVEEITHYTRAGEGCTTCHPDLANILKRVLAERDVAVSERPRAAATVTAGSVGADGASLQMMQRIQEVLDREVRPGLAMDGGDMELVDIQGNQVLVRLHGHCNSCMASSSTMKFFVQDRLKELVDPNLEVVDITEHSSELHAPPMR